MSGTGAPAARPVDGAAGLRVAVVASEWHTEVMAGLLGGARRALADAGSASHRAARARHVRAHRGRGAPGRRSRYDAIVALGVVIRGGTPHFDYVCQSATPG